VWYGMVWYGVVQKEGVRVLSVSDWWELNEWRAEGQKECHIRIHDNHENHTHSLRRGVIGTEQVKRQLQ
jgi:hypothetical protein